MRGVQLSVSYGKDLAKCDHTSFALSIKISKAMLYNVLQSLAKYSHDFCDVFVKFWLKATAFRRIADWKLES